MSVIHPFSWDSCEVEKCQKPREKRRFSAKEGAPIFDFQSDALPAELPDPNAYVGAEKGPPHVLSVRGQCVRWLGAAKGIAFFVVEDTSGYAKTPRQPHALHPDVLTIADLSVDEEVLRVVMKQLVKGGKETAIEFKRPALSSEIEE